MRQRNVGDALIVVVRYFGGIQLGASGLVRAYSSTAVSALDAACVEERVETIEATIRCSYEHESLVRRITASSEAAIREVRYEDLVSFRVRLRADLAGELHDRLRDVSDGRIVMDVGS
jgi:putative IMPACT (imprinted ancient) family translation regulator